MTDNRHEEESTQISVVEKNDAFTHQERRPVLISLRGELLATPIPLERDSVVLGRAVEA